HRRYVVLRSSSHRSGSHCQCGRELRTRDYMRDIGLCLAALGPLLFGCDIIPGEDVDSSEHGETARVATCSAEQQAAAPPRMVAQPIKAPRMYAGIDLAGGEDWTGLTIERAEETLCQPTTSAADDNGHTSVSWGGKGNSSGPVTVSYDDTTHQIDFVQLNA